MSADRIYNEAAALIRGGSAAEAVGVIRGWLDGNPDDEVGLSLLGSALLKLGELDGAVDALQLNVAAHPQSFAAHGDLGFAYMTAGNADEAIAALQRALAINPGFYQGWCYLGKLRFDQGDPQAAQSSFAQADSCDPFIDECQAIRTAMQSGHLAAAEKTARGILARQRGHPQASFALAHIAASVSAFEEAAEILGIAIESFPCDLNLRSALVNSLEETGDYSRALEEARAAAALDGDNPSRWLAVGRVCGHCGRYQEALSAYDQAYALSRGDSEKGKLQLLRGHMLKVLGQYEDAVRAYRASIAAVEDNGAAWWGLADLKVHRFSDADVEHLRRLLGRESVKPAQRSQAAFALGKALEDRRDYENAFVSYRAANEMRPDVTFDAAAFSAAIDEIIAAFSGSTLSKSAATVAGPTPIFIVGLPRSGSTLIEQILASHSQVEGTMELVDLPNLVRRIGIDGGRRNAHYPRSMSGFSSGELTAYGRAYLESTALYRNDKPFFIDKLPTNFDKAGLIHMILPSAIIIDARRHPLDCGISCYRQHFAAGHHFSYRLDHIGHYYNGYLKLMEHWDRVLPGRIFRVQYERLVENTDETVAALLAHCGLPFEEQCLRYFENRRAVRTASSEQVRQPIYLHGIGQWKNFEPQLRPLVEALGFPLPIHG